MQHLSLQVRQRDVIVIDDANLANARRGEILDQRRSEPSGADHQHARGFELLLAGATDAMQHDVASVALDFLFRQRHAGNSPRHADQADRVGDLGT